jgi:serine---pyruvate transaminase
LELLAAENPAPGVTGIMVPGRIDSSKIVRYMRDVVGVTVQGGQDQMKGKLVRIGHMGYVAPLDVLVAIGALELALRNEGFDFQIGAGVAAAQAEIASGS